MNRSHLCWSIVLLIFLWGCGSPSTEEDESSTDHTVKIHLAGDPKSLNPYMTPEIRSVTVRSNIFQPLINLSYDKTKIVPVLAESLPTIEKTKEARGGEIRISFKIRPEARWDNGDPITAKDVAFSLKVMKNSHVKSHALRSYFEFINRVELHPDNPRLITFCSDTPYILAEAAFCDLPIIPRHVYDPDRLMQNFTVADLSPPSKEVMDDTLLKQFGGVFNSNKFQRKPDFVKGSGPYKLKEWESGQKVVLTRKENWWGDTLSSVPNHFFEAYPKELNYQIINDRSTALSALKDGQLDVMSDIKARDFKKLPESEAFQEQFNRYSPPSTVFSYIGLNTRQPKLQQEKVRQALAYLTDVDQIIETVSQGLAERVVGPVPPQNEAAYNDTLSPYPYNLDKAQTLLQKAGWEDSNNNGTVDRKVKGKVREMELDYLIPSGNENAKDIGLILQEATQKAGVSINIKTLESSVLIQRLKKHQFDMYVSGWSFPPQPFDPKQIFHTSAAQGGSNFVGFGNPETDRLIENIRHTIDKKKRAHLYRRLQEVLHQQVPYIFLVSPHQKIAIHKRFDNVITSVVRPGYWAPSLNVSSDYEGS